MMAKPNHLPAFMCLAMLLCMGSPCSSSLYGQSFREWVRDANRFYQRGDYASAVYNFKQAVALKPDDEGTQWLLAEAAREARDYAAAADAYEATAKLARGSRQRNAIFWQAMMKKQAGDLEAWESGLRQFNEHPAKVEEALQAHADAELKSVEKVRHLAHADSLKWKVRNAGPILNSDFAEVRPWPLGDSLLVFSSSLPMGEEDDVDAQLFRLFQATRTYKGFEKPSFLDKRLNQDDMHTGNPAFSPDGEKLYFTVCGRSKGSTGPCEIWVTERSRNRWVRTRPLDDPINIKNYTSTQPAPAMNGDQEVLYFVSNRPGGSGGLDIWYSVLKKGVPTAPVNLGTPVNTPGDEVTPYYDHDKGGLYYSSDRHPGLGGWDVFFTKGGLGKWEAPVNLGMEINSPAEDFGYIPPASGYPGYLVSNRPGSRTLGEETCCFDIYLAELMVQREPEDKRDPGKSIAESQEKASRINNILPLSLYFDNDHPDPRSTSELTQHKYSSTLEEYISKMPEFISRYSQGLAPARSKQAADSISRFFDQEVLPAKERLQTLLSILYETLSEGRDVELVVRGYASPLNTPSYNKILAARRIRSLVNELKTWNKGVLSPYFDGTAPNRARLSIQEIPVGVADNARRISADPGDLRNAVFSPEASRARRISILYGKVEGMVGKTGSGETSIHMKGNLPIPAVPEGSHHLAILSFENAGTFPLNIDAVTSPDPRIQTAFSEILLAPGKTGEIYLKIDGPWNPTDDALEVVVHGNLPGGKHVFR